MITRLYVMINMIKTMTMKKNSKEKGMTLVETMVALVVLTIGLIPILGVVTSSITLAIRIENNLIAANLAQEGIEVVRAIRDASWMNSDLFDKDLPGGDYLVAWDSTSLIPFNPDVHLKIKDNGVYSYDAASPDTIFKRQINITKMAGGELKVVSKVTWTERQQNKTVDIESYLFDWQ